MSHLIDDNKRKFSFVELYNDAAKKFANNTAFIYKPEGHTEKSKYIEKSFIDFNRDRIILKKHLQDNGYLNKKIAVTGRNSYVWSVVASSVLSSDNIIVPLDKDLPVEEMKLSLQRAEIDILIYDEKYKDVILKATKNLKKIKLYTFNDIQELFNKNSIDLKKLIEYDNKNKEKTKKEDLKVLLFTSGTTSLSKIVMLSRDNLITNMYDVAEEAPFYTTDTNLALLPFHHVFGLVCSLLMICWGVRTAFTDGLRYIPQNMEEYKISVFVGVPQLFETMYNKIVENAKKMKKWKTLQLLIKFSNGLLKLGIDIRRKLFKIVINALGGHMRFIITAAAPIKIEVIKFFNDIGILTIQGYGLTETSPVLTAETKRKQKLGSVGVPVRHAQIKIDKEALYNFYLNSLGFKENDPALEEILNGKEGEILAKGRNVTQGYYKDPKRNKEAFTKDGWFKTGDIGYIEDEFLFVTGRIKDMIVLSNGKKAFPEEMELLVNNIKGVIESFVFGSNKNLGFGSNNDTKIHVAIYYDKDYFKNKSKEKIQEYFSNEIKTINRTLPQYKYIKGILLYEKEFTKTTTRKIKRYIEKENMENLFTVLDN